MSVSSDVLKFLHGLYRFQTVAELSENICRELPGLVGGENAIICRHDANLRIITAMVATHAFSRANVLPHINESGAMALHPLWEHAFDPRRPVIALSSVVSQAEWHGNPMYNEVFAHDGIEDQIHIEVEGDPVHFTSLNVLRGKRGFSREAQDIMLALRPHVAQAFANAALVEKAGLVSGLADGNWLIPVNMTGRVDLDGEALLPALSARLGGCGRLPDGIERWIRDQIEQLNGGAMETALEPLIYRDQACTWRCVLFRDFDRGRYLLSLRLLDDRRSPDRLSPREMEIFRWVAEGKTNEEIAIILGISLNTVKTYIRRGLLKLGAENRIAAAATWRTHLECHPKG